MERAHRRVIETTVAAGLCGVHYETMRRWADEGVLPPGVAWKVVGRWPFAREALLPWYDGFPKAASPEPQQGLLF
ncbi:MAG: helix-turn-helix domain-containing protein [Acidobacteria bacterium]|nr:helix-turn-helix domain-containing protein [Acidobacteriota bacterium]